MKRHFADILADKTIKNADNISDASVRKSYSTLSSVCGMVCNIILFAVKLFAGIITSSIAVMTDAFNNLADCAGCIVTLLGCRMAAKPADKEHPYGHGRMEYLTALGLSALIFIMGAKLIKESVEKMISPAPVKLTVLSFAILIISVAVKLMMFSLNDRLGKRIDSVVLAAVAKDSLGDVAATSAAALSLILSEFTSLPFDGIAGALVSLLILRSGFEIVKDTADELLGSPADPETVDRLEKLICSNERILGVHDILIHSYGPSNIIGSCHAEIADTETFVGAHELVDSVEHEVLEKLGIKLTIHMDPAAVNDSRTAELRRKLGDFLSQTDSRLSFHDLRVCRSPDGDKLSFDLSVPYGFSMSDTELKKAAADVFADDGLDLRITIDRR